MNKSAPDYADRGVNLKIIKKPRKLTLNLDQLVQAGRRQSQHRDLVDRSAHQRLRRSAPPSRGGFERIDP